MIDSVTEASLLYDFYGQLLTEKKRRVMELYHEENLSLAEIADQFGISRAAVYDSLKSAEKSLREYEDKLGLMEKLLKTRQAAGEIDLMIEDLVRDNIGNKPLVSKLKDIKSVINRLEEV